MFHFFPYTVLVIIMNGNYFGKSITLPTSYISPCHTVVPFLPAKCASDWSCFERLWWFCSKSDWRLQKQSWRLWNHNVYQKEKKEKLAAVHTYPIAFMMSLEQGKWCSWLHSSMCVVGGKIEKRRERRQGAPLTWIKLLDYKNSVFP